MALLPTAKDLVSGAVITAQPDATYKMRVEEEMVQGQADGLEAIEQACYKILNTERYRYVIYSWNYGVELDDLYGKPIPYVFSELPRRIREALLQDDRVQEVTNFELSHVRGDVLAKFEVVTKRGILMIEKGVTVI